MFFGCFRHFCVIGYTGVWGEIGFRPSVNDAPQTRIDCSPAEASNSLFSHDIQIDPRTSGDASIAAPATRAGFGKTECVVLLRAVEALAKPAHGARFATVVGCFGAQGCCEAAQLAWTSARQAHRHARLVLECPAILTDSAGRPRIAIAVSRPCGTTIPQARAGAPSCMDNGRDGRGWGRERGGRDVSISSASARGCSRTTARTTGDVDAETEIEAVEARRCRTLVMVRHSSRADKSATLPCLACFHVVTGRTGLAHGCRGAVVVDRARGAGRATASMPRGRVSARGA